MKFSTGTRLAALALMAGLWGCSSSKVAQQSLAYDDLYSSSTDVKAVAYSSKRSSATFDPTRTTTANEPTTEGTGSTEYYNPELAERYSNRTYTEGYRAGYDDASRWGNNWNNGGWNNFNGWGGGWNSWNRFNNFYSPWGMGGWGPGLSLNFGFGGGWGWNRFNNFYSPWGFDPFFSGWGGGFNDGFGGWGWGNRYRINNHFYGGGYPYGGGNVVIVNPGANNGGSTPVYSNPRRERANYGRSQSAYNSDADRAYSSSSNPATRGGRSSYSTPSNSSDYYSRPKRSGDIYSGTPGNRTENSYSRPSNNGYNNSNNSYSRGYDRGSSGSNTYSAPARTSAPSAPSSSPAGGGGGARSRGPR